MEQEQTQFDIQRYIKLLLKRKWLWIIPTILFAIGSVIYASILPDIYESRCVLIVEDSKVLYNLIGGGGGESATRMLQVVRERMLGWQSVVRIIKLLELDKGLNENDMGGMEKSYRNVTRKVDLRTIGNNLMQVSYRGESPEINFRIVDELVSNFMEFNLKETRTEADETVEFIEVDLARLQDNLDKSEQQLREFEEEHLDDLPGSQSSMQVSLSDAKQRLVAIDRELNDLNQQIGFLDDHLEKENKTITGEITRVPNPKVGDLNKQINDLEIEVNTLRSKYFDEHPSIVKKLKVLESLKEMLEKESEKIVSEEKIVNNPVYSSLMQKEFVVQLKLKTLQRQRKDTEEAIARLEESVKSMPAMRQKLGELQRGYNVNKQLYEQRLMQKAKADLVKNMSLDAKTNPFTIVEPARISYQPIKVIKIRIIGIGIIMGFGLGVGLIFGWEQIDQRFKTMEEVQGYLNIPALGMIPTILTNTEIKRKTRRKIIVSSSLAAFFITATAVCLIVEPVKTIVSDKANHGWDKLVELIKE